MALDYSQLPPDVKAQAEMFHTMLQTMPTEALRFLALLLQHEIDGRGD